MRIFYISASFLPSHYANSVHVMKMCQALARAGHEVTLFGHPGAEPAKTAHDYYGVKNVFGLGLHPRPPWGPLWPVGYALSVVRDIVRRPRPDLFYGRHSYTLAVCARRFPGTGIILESHTLPQNLVQRLAEHWLMTRRNFRALVVISEALKTDYRQMFPFLPEEKIIVAHDGADILPAAEILPYPLQGRAGRKRLCYAGRLIEGKGAGMIAALAPLCPDMDFHVFGGTGAELAHWKEKAAAANVFFYGHVPHDDLVRRVYPAMDIMLAPLQAFMPLSGRGYDIGRWTSPLKIFEYMAAGKPIICSDIPVLREILDDGANCRMCPPGDVSAWRTAVESVACDSRTAAGLGAGAREKLLRHYTWDVRAQDVLSRAANSNKIPVRRRLLFVLPTLTSGGAERVLLTYMNAVQGADFDVSLFVMARRGELSSWIAPGIPVHYAWPQGLLAGLPALLRHIWRVRPAAVITTMAPMNFALLLLRPFAPRSARFIVREATLPSSLAGRSRRGRLVSFLYRKLYPLADVVISPASRISAEFHDHLGMPDLKPALLHNPVEEAHIRQKAAAEDKKEDSLPGDTVRFVAAGRLDPAKGYDRLIERLTDLPQDMKWHLTIWGEGRERPALEALIKEKNLSERVALPGLTANPWVQMAAADAFLLPSRWEGLPNVVLESLAVGTPVIATAQAGGIQEIADMAPSGAVQVAPFMDDFIRAMIATRRDDHKGVRPSLLPPHFLRDNVVASFRALVTSALMG